MTTICTDGKTMAGDGRVTGSGVIFQDDLVKVFSCGDTIYGYCGSPYYESDVRAFVSGLTNTLDVGEDFEALVLTYGGDVFCLDGKGRRYKSSIPAAIGSGSGYALAAMYAGCDPVDAVDIATRLDFKSGGTLTHIGFGDIS